MSIAKISGKGQLTLPSEIRKKYNMTKSSLVRVIPLEDGVKLVPINKGGISALRGIIKVDGKQDFKAIRHQVMEARVHERD